jgi:hypothetical protein
VQSNRKGGLISDENFLKQGAAHRSFTLLVVWHSVDCTFYETGAQRRKDKAIIAILNYNYLRTDQQRWRWRRRRAVAGALSAPVCERTTTK